MSLIELSYIKVLQITESQGMESSLSLLQGVFGSHLQPLLFTGFHRLSTLLARSRQRLAKGTAGLSGGAVGVRSWMKHDTLPLERLADLPHVSGTQEIRAGGAANVDLGLGLHWGLLDLNGVSTAHVRQCQQFLIHGEGTHMALCRTLSSLGI